MIKVSILLLTIDRYQMTKYCVTNAILNSGLKPEEIELLVLDNGSKDRRIIDFCKKISTVHIAMQKNIGVAAGYNLLLKASTGEYLCTIGNDIYLQPGWLTDLIQYSESIKKSGISGIHCVFEKGIYDASKDVYVPQNAMIYSTTFFKRSLLNDIGGFDEKLSIYGCEDSQLAWRAAMSGYLNYYVPNQSSTHLGDDLNCSNEYRRAKSESLVKNTEILKKTLDIMHKTKNYKLHYGKVR